MRRMLFSALTAAMAWFAGAHGLLYGRTADDSNGGRENQSPSAGRGRFRVMSWNIQDGMWDGQGDDYARFVAYVKAKAPDVCIWTEAESLLKTGKCEDLPAEERFLPKGWPALAARYGHGYVYLAEHRDNYPQVITSHFPIENVKRIGGAEGQSDLPRRGLGDGHRQRAQDQPRHVSCLAARVEVRLLASRGAPKGEHRRARGRLPAA